METMLFCRICKTDLPFGDFSPYQQKNKYSRCKKCVNQLSNEWAKKNPEKANAKSARHRAKVGKEAYNARIRRSQRKLYPEVKAKVFDHYGWECACCGESIKQFLQIDHINNDGAQHRKSLKMSSGTSFYYWLIRNNFPDDYQTLCVNCNWGKLVNGGICPHKEQPCTLINTPQTKYTNYITPRVTDFLTQGVTSTTVLLTQ